MRIEDGNLNHAYNADELLNQTHAIWGGVAWPSDRPGYAVIIGAGTQRHLDAYDIHIMAEFECSNTRELVRQCAALNVKYADILAIKDRLQSKLQALFDGLDGPYQQIELILEALNPGEVLIEPLSVTYQQILDKFEGVSVRAIFQPLLDALASLRDALIEGIDRTSDAFKAFLSAAPSVSVSVSVSL